MPRWEECMGAWLHWGAGCSKERCFVQGCSLQTGLLGQGRCWNAVRCCTPSHPHCHRCCPECPCWPVDSQSKWVVS